MTNLNKSYFIRNTFICTLDEKFEYNLRKSKSLNDLSNIQNQSIDKNEWIENIQYNLSNLFYNYLMTDVEIQFSNFSKKILLDFDNLIKKEIDLLLNINKEIDFFSLINELIINNSKTNQ
jgi:hypothetical protein